jgi:L-arabinokinase
MTDRVRRIGDVQHRSAEADGACRTRIDPEYRAGHFGTAGPDEAGAARGIYGAKITGGGSGGTVALLCDATAGAVVRDIAARYAARTGRGARVVEGSSPGAARMGALRLDPA